MQYLSGTGSDNAQFQDIDIQAGNVPSGQTLALNAIGTVSTANLVYIFPGNFTVSSGATMSVASNLPVDVEPNVTLTDNGTVTFANGDTVALSYYTTEIVVGNGGLMSASGTTFNGYAGYTSEIIVDSGGHLTASNCTFASSLTEVNLNTGAILNAGDFTGNSFNCPLYIPENDVQYLSGTGSDNAQFQDIDIQAGNVPSGQTLALNAIGTVSTANLVYIFPGNFTVSSGATMSVASNLPVDVEPNVTLTDNGTVTFANGDTVALSYYTTEIVVGNGGLMSASGTTFNGYAGYTSEIIVNSGGHLTASNCTFASSLTQVTVNSGGAFSGTGSVASPFTVQGNGTLSPGVPVGTLDVNSLTLSSGSQVSVTLENGTSGNFGQLSYSGSLSLSGANLAVEAGNLSVGEQFTIVTTASGTLTGTFSNAPTTITAANNPEDVFSVSYANDKVTLTVTSVGLAVSAVAINEDISAGSMPKKG